MADKLSKEEQQKLANAQFANYDEKYKLRQKQIAQLKASNELLESAKENISKHFGKDSDETLELFKKIDIAKEQNINRGKEYLGASESEIEGAQYNKVSEGEVSAYNRRLKMKGLTDEELRRKDLTSSMPSKEVETEDDNSVLGKLKNRLKKVNKSKTEEKQTPVAVPVEDKEYIKENTMKVEDIQSLDSSSELKEDNFFNEFKNQPVKEEIKKIKIIKEDDKPVISSIEPISNKTIDYKDFDPRSVASYIQYDMIPLPSKGECYPHKKTHLPVAYLTAADENLIASPNLYNNGTLLDIILERKILDKSIRVSDLVDGDRDAIIIWLRASAYGNDYPIMATYKGENFQTSVDLSKLKYYDFNLKGDENGLFEYKCKNGDVIKFKYPSHKEETELQQEQLSTFNDVNADSIVKSVDNIISNINNIENKDINKEEMIDIVNEIKKWAQDIPEDKNTNNEEIYYTAITSRMYCMIQSINGNSDREFIKLYVDNMRSGDAKEFREFIINNMPGVDFKIKVNVPESLGGGSFETFLTYSEVIFTNV